jgi:hypothetical protein
VSTETGQRLVDRVVDDFEDHVMQSRAVRGIPDVHPGALADRLQALQDLDAVRIVVVRVGTLLFRF